MTSTDWKLLRTPLSSSRATSPLQRSSVRPPGACVPLPRRIDVAVASRGTAHPRIARPGGSAAADAKPASSPPLTVERRRRRRGTRPRPNPGPPTRNRPPSPGRAGAKPISPTRWSKVKTRIGVEQRIARQRPGVVAAALDVVPGIAARAVVTGASGANDCQALIDQAAQDEVRGQHVFQSGPDLLGIGRRHRRFFGCPSGHVQTRRPASSS